MGIILKKITKIISNIIFYILLAIIILLVAYVILVNVYKKQNKLGDIPINFYTILTQSMYPKIKAGDIIITYKNKDDIYKVSDVITFISESNVSKGVTITHRIQSVNLVDGKNYYTTKGDNNNSPDSAPVSSNNVMGKVILKIPKAGFIQQFLVSKFGWLVAIVLPCLGILIYDIIKIFKKIIKNNKQKKLLTSKNAVASKEDLQDLIEDKYVSKELEKKIDTVYEEIGIKQQKNDDIETLYDNSFDTLEKPPEEKKEEDDVEIL